MKNNVLLLIPHYGKGGAERMFHYQSSLLTPEYEVIEVVFNTDISDFYGDLGNKRESLDVAAGKSFFDKTLNFIRRCIRLRKLKRKYKPVATISHLEGANFVNICSGGYGKIITCIHGSKTAPDKNRKGLVRFIENSILSPILYKIPNKIITVSAGIKDELMNQFGISNKKIIVLENGIDIEKINHLKLEEITQVHTSVFKLPTIIFTGRISNQKNPLLLIRIFRQLLRSTRINLLIIGEGDLKETIVQELEENSIPYFDETFPDNIDSPAVYFLSWQQNPFKYIYQSHIYLSTSLFEGYPLAICESIVCGTPVIASDCPTGVNEILNNGQTNKAYLKPYDDPIKTDFGVLFPNVSESQQGSLDIHELEKMILEYLGTKNTIPENSKVSFIKKRSLSEYKRSLLKVLM